MQLDPSRLQRTTTLNARHRDALDAGFLRVLVLHQGATYQHRVCQYAPLMPQANATHAKLT